MKSPKTVARELAAMRRRRSMRKRLARIRAELGPDATEEQVLTESLTRDIAKAFDIPRELIETTVHTGECTEDFIEMLGPETGYNLLHPHYEGQHSTGEDCPCGPTRVTHAKLPPAVLDDDAEFGDDDLPTVDEALRFGWAGSPAPGSPAWNRAHGVKPTPDRGHRVSQSQPGDPQFDGDPNELGRGIGGF